MITRLCTVLLLTLFLASCNKSKDSTNHRNKPENNVLTILTYYEIEESGLLDITLSDFVTKNKCEIVLEVVENPYELVNKIVNKDIAYDIVLGVDNTIFSKIAEEDYFLQYKSDNTRFTDTDIVFDSSFRITAVAYGYLAILYDSMFIDKPPATFGKLQDGIWKNQFLLSHPQSSTQGLGMLLWSISAFGENGYGHFWRSIKNNVHTITEDWDYAYSMFLSGEAPMVIGYSTTPLAFVELEKNNRYSSFFPEEGSFRHFMGIAISSDSKNTTLAKKYVDYSLSRDFQFYISTTLWLYPVNIRVNLPDSFDGVSVPNNVMNDNTRVDKSKIDGWIDRWINLME